VRNMLRTLLVLLVFSFLTNLVLAAGSMSDDDKAAYGKQKKMNEVSREMAKTINQEIVFYGKVVDFEGQPVPGAVVDMHTRIFGVDAPKGNIRRLSVTADGDGRFVAESHGEMISLDDIRKDGYVYKFRYNPMRSVNSAVKELRKGPSFEPDQPIVYRMRKLAPSAYLTSDSLTFGLKDGRVELLDLYEHQWVSPDRVFTHRMGAPYWHADVSFRAEGSGDKFTLFIEALDEGSGFAVQAVEFYEELTRAPDEGYQQKLEVPVPKNKSGVLTLYVKGEGGLFYSRMMVRYWKQDNYDGVRLDVSEATNPTGDKALEFDPERYRQRNRDNDKGNYWKLSRELLRKGEIYIPQAEVNQ